MRSPSNSADRRLRGLEHHALEPLLCRSSPRQRLEGHVQGTRPLRLLATLNHALADHIEEKLPDITVPVLVVCGARDPVVTVAWSTEAARLVGISSPGAAGATLSVVPTAAHALPYDDPVTFATLISAFVATLHARTIPR